MRVKDCCPNCYMNRGHRETKEKLVAYLGGKCICCGYSKCMDALEFHHLDASKKEFSICNAKSKSIERQLNEVRKCILVCANCHREIESGLIPCPKTQIFIDYKYPKLKVKSKQIYRCVDCNKEVSFKSKRCRDCSYKSRKRIERPSREQLLEDVRELGYCGTGRKYGVADNTIRKWLR